MSFRDTFLIAFAAVALHVSLWEVCIFFIGYLGFAGLDKWLAKRAKEKVIDNEIFGWKVDSEHPGWETRNELWRIRLPSNEQVLVTRVAELLKRIP